MRVGRAQILALGGQQRYTMCIYYVYIYRDWVTRGMGVAGHFLALQDAATLGRWAGRAG